ncbi:MAG: hypothetical protein Q8Q33_09075 [Chlamydiota bacterium]|nr:hypothetical protein [Chlamydiota bacterium]
MMICKKRILVYLFFLILFSYVAACSGGINHNTDTNAPENTDSAPKTPDDPGEIPEESIPEDPDKQPETSDTPPPPTIFLAAGQYGGFGYRDAPQYNARLSSSNDVVIDSKGCAYISDTNNHVIRKYWVSWCQSWCQGLTVDRMMFSNNRTFDFSPFFLAISSLIRC